MKMIVAHLPNNAFEPVRSELADLGVQGITICSVQSAGSERVLQYRGTPMPTYLQSALKLECLATAAQSESVVAILRAHGSGGPIAVLDLEELHQGATAVDAFPGDPRLAAAA